MDRERHSIILENRKNLVIDGVTDVISFDDINIDLDTLGGRLSISGNELHIHTLCLEKGQIAVDGQISELVYQDVEQRSKKGMFGRLFGQ